MTLFKLLLKWFTIFSLITLLGIGAGAYVFYKHLISNLPDVAQLKQVKYQTPFKIYSHDKKLIAQFGEKKRIPTNINDVPKQLIQAFLAAEDDRYYDHPGVDYKGLARAFYQLLSTGKKRQGGSTITMQVTRNFLLSREKTYIRKFREIILSLQIEKTYSKDKILEFYLNKIYMGHRSYGIVAAAETYYGRPLNELTLAQQAMIAGLPKAPSAYNPVSNPDRALIRRNYILRRMETLLYISPEEAAEAREQPVTARLHYPKIEFRDPFIAEMVRREMIKRYGQDTYTNGMNVYTTIGSHLQTTATKSLWYALHLYDKRHGYHAPPFKVFTSEENFQEHAIIGDTYPAQILSIKKGIYNVRLQDNSIINIPWSRFLWAANRFRTGHYPKGVRRPRSLSSALKVNTIIRIRPLKNNKWEFTQVPKVQGAFAAINPMNGAIQAVVGGFDFHQSEYNRATQAKRQPGSGFKPVIYSTALKEGYTLASFINDSPIIIRKGSAKDRAWRPQNYSHRYYGPTRIRQALYKSRNIVSIKLAQKMGLTKVIQTAKDFGFKDEQLPRGLSIALGSGWASPLRMANFYAIFANGGFLVKPYFIERIENHKGEIIFAEKPKTACPLCKKSSNKKALNSKQILSTRAPRVLSAEITFLMNSVLRDVIRRGTAVRAKSLNRHDLAGKTGTTNSQKDGWFNGFHSSIAASAWMGFDSYKTLGKKETGGSTALPMWIHFMRTALKNQPQVSLSLPKGVVKKSIYSLNNVKTGGLPGATWEYFERGVYPKKRIAPVSLTKRLSTSTKKKSTPPRYTPKSKKKSKKKSRPKPPRLKDKKYKKAKKAKKIKKVRKAKVIKRTVEDLF
ncbi:MAG: penicillin-binding protein 1A [Methylococcales bacterium]|nr:penicillin-binding protein 1A [Methylococcales bacterium]